MACAVESAARVHPNWTVHLLSVDGDGHATNDSSAPFVNLLGSIQNVVLSDIDPLEEFEGTPLRAWYQSGALNNSSYPVEHLADALRLAVLYNRGGVYLDIDVVVMRPLYCLPSFVCQSPAWRGDLVSNGFLGFHRGDPFLLKLMNHTSRAYQPNKWSSIGPRLLRDVTLAYCGKRSVKELVGRRCGADADFTVLSHRKFLPVRYDSSARFLAANASKEVWHICNDSYVMHVYSRTTSKMPSEPGSAYRQAAKAYCPDSLQLSLNLTGKF
ncbi:lactosylceramide 4-alpha-galactosyltransferase-like [Amblyomma americanum]